MWYVGKENAHLVRMKEVTDLVKELNQNLSSQQKKKRNADSCVYLMWVKGYVQSESQSYLNANYDKCVVLFHSFRNVDVKLQLGHPLLLKT